jgi:hypothetical protein
MLLATKTMKAIEEAMVADQGAKFRGLLGELMPSASDAYSTKNEDWRNHLGASLIGRECARELWYSFHWATLKRFDGQMLRLFNRGHLEEPRFIAMLKMIGCQVWQQDQNCKQFRIEGHRGHFGGSMDGVVIGVPDLPPATPAIAEFKTHGEKSFAKLKSGGVLTAKREHFVQMQLYMGKNRLVWALYAAVCKNTDELHMELVQFDEAQYQRYLERSVMIIEAKEPPPKISTTPGWFGCRFCDQKDVCHFGKPPERHCRTCASSVILDDGKWQCAVTELELSGADQRAGCPAYQKNPVFKP